jgi:hypothetical protein
MSDSGTVRRELRVPLDRGYRTRTPTLVGRGKSFGAADRERRNNLQAEGTGMIVVHEHDHVGLGGGDPAL